jgi:hypothetical protein
MIDYREPIGRDRQGEMFGFVDLFWWRVTGAAARTDVA